MTQPNYIFTTFTFYSSIAFIAGLLNILIVIRQKPSAVRKSLVWTLLIYLGWTFSSTLFYASTNMDEKLAWHKLYLIFYSITPVFIAITLLQLAQAKTFLTKKWLIAFFLIPSISIVLILTNEFHHLVWKPDPILNVDTNLLYFFYWRWYYSGIVLMTFIEILSSFLAIYIAKQNSLPNYKLQFALITVGFFTPLVGKAGYFYGKLFVPGFDPLNGLIAITLGIFTLSIYAFKLISIIPVQIYQILNLLPDAVIVLNAEDFLLYQNERAKELIATNHSAKSLFPVNAINEIGEKYPIPNGDEFVEVPLDITSEKQFIHKIDKTLKSETGEVQGRIIIYRDISDQKKISDLQHQAIMLQDMDNFIGLYTNDLNEFVDNLNKDLNTLRVELDEKDPGGNSGLIDSLMSSISLYRSKFDQTIAMFRQRSVDRNSLSAKIVEFLESYDHLEDFSVTFSMPEIDLDKIIDDEILMVLIDLLNEQLNYASTIGMATHSHTVLFVDNGQLSVIYSDDSPNPNISGKPTKMQVAWKITPRIENRFSNSGSNVLIHFPKAKQKNVNQLGLSGKRVLIADQQQLFASSFGTNFRSGGMFYLGNIHDPKMIGSSLKGLKPDILLLSVDWPQELIVDIISANKISSVNAIIILVGVDISEKMLIDLHNQIDGFISKNQTIEEVYDALSEAVKGEKVFYTPVLNRLLRLDGNLAKNKQNEALKILRSKGIKYNQIQILLRIGSGLTYKQISVELGLSQSAVKYHVGEMIKTLGLHNKADLIKYCHQIDLF